MSLFSDNFPEIKTDQELAALLKQHPDYDAGYICQGAYGLRRKVRQWMESLWLQYQPYADTDFLGSFKRNFNARSWELYLGVTLINRGFMLGAHNDAGPDFDVRDQNGNRITWIEAISARKGDGPDRVPEMNYRVAVNVPEENMSLRVAAALDAKYRKYQSDLTNGFIAAGDPYVIAINRSELEHIEMPPSLILKVLFGIGHQAIRFPVPGTEVTPPAGPEAFWQLRPNIRKKSGNEVSMTFFANPAHAGISAVIYCIDNVINSPRLSNEMGENFIVVHNPLATNPLSSEALPFGEEYRATDEYVHQTREAKQHEGPGAHTFDYLDEE
ncbi:hypothetical protein K2Q00_03055 [Patescibacteria group bacterium]|nr:hypothetical protein [Patescibacteria group bacterium]